MLNDGSEKTYLRSCRSQIDANTNFETFRFYNEQPSHSAFGTGESF